MASECSTIKCANIRQRHRYCRSIFSSSSRCNRRRRQHAADNLLSSQLLAVLITVLQPIGAGGAEHETSPPVYGAYPTGGPVNGGTTVTIVGKEFGRINTVGLDRVRCSWGDPRPWQQAVFAAQQAEMDGWAPDESVLPTVPPTYFTHATSVVSEVPVTDAIRSTFGLSSDINKVDMLECPSHEYECNGVDCDVNLWFSLRFYETVRCQSRHTAPEAPAATSAAAEAAVARAALAPQRSHNGGRNERWVLVAHGRSRAPAHVDGIV